MLLEKAKLSDKNFASSGYPHMKSNLATILENRDMKNLKV